jgi:hypothetical protein
MGFTRARIALLAVVAIFVAASVAYASHQADPELSLSRTQASSGEEVGFKIANTEAWSEYTLTVENEVVARGSDPAGNGIDDKFKMPDLGNAEKSVTVEVTVKQPSHTDPFVGTATMQYVLFPTAPTGPTTQPQPEPVPLVPTPASQVSPTPATTTAPSAPSPTNRKKRATKRNKRTSGNKKQSSGETGGSGNSTPTSTTPVPTSTAPSAGTIAPAPTTSPRSASSPTPQKPSGPVGTAGFQPPSGPPPGGSTPGGPPPSAPITGTATITGDGGFPTALLVALLLLALAALAVAATRTRYIDWHRFRFAFAGPHDPDEMRLGALARAARSGAETQQAIAVRKASRRSS